MIGLPCSTDRRRLEMPELTDMVSRVIERELREAVCRIYMRPDTEDVTREDYNRAADAVLTALRERGIDVDKEPA